MPLLPRSKSRLSQTKSAHFLALLVGLSLVGVCVHADTSHLQSAAQLLEQGNLAGAEAEARAAMTDVPSRPVAYAILGAIRLQQKNYPAGAHFLETAVRLNPQLIGAQLNLGNVYILEGKPAQAEAMFHRVLKLDSANFNARFALSRLESESGHYAESLKIAEPINEQLHRSEDGLLLLASDYLALDDRAKLTGIATDWSALSRPLTAGTLSMAELFARHGLYNEAISFLEESKAVDGGAFEIYSHLGAYYFKQGNAVQATANYKLALEAQSNCSDCLYHLGRIAEQDHRLDEALSFLIEARRYAPNDPDVLFEFGRICVQKDLYADAIESLTAAAKLRPKDESFQYVLASAYTGKKEYKPAIMILNHLLTLHPNDPLMSYSLGAVEYLDSDLGVAEQHLQHSIAIDPQQVASYYYLGLTKEGAGKSDEAVQILQALADRYPNNASAFTALGEILNGQHKYADARTSLEKAIQLDSHSVKAHYQLGIALGRLGQAEDSKREFALVKSLNAETDNQTEMRIFSQEK